MSMNNAPDQGIPDGYTLVYRPTGRYAHFADTGDAGGYCEVYCRLGGTGWLGTGSQEQYERAASLPKCPACLRATGREAEAVSRMARLRGVMRRSRG